MNNNKLEIGGTFSGNPAGSRQDDIHRFLATASGSPYTNSATTPQLYLSFRVNFRSLPAATAASTYFAHYYVNSTTFIGKLSALAGNPALNAPTNLRPCRAPTGSRSRTQ